MTALLTGGAGTISEWTAAAYTTARSARDLRRLSQRLPSAFPAGLGRIPNNPVVAAVLAAILKGGPKARHLSGGWTERDGRPVYRHIGKRGGEIVITVDAQGGDWTVVESFSALTADVMVAVLAQMCEPSLGNKSMYPLLLPVPVTAGSVLRYKGTRHWGAERAQLRGRVVEEMNRLQALRIDVLRFPAWDPGLLRWNHRGVSVTGDRLFDVVDFILAGDIADGERLDEAGWAVRVGHWGQWWMNAQAKVWLSPMPQRLIALDHRKNRASEVLAKKIGFNALVYWGAARSAVQIDRRIDYLLETVGELPRPEARDAHWAGRIRDRFDEAMLLLAESDLFGNLSWPTGFQPGESARTRGWVEPWLSSSFTFGRPHCFV